MAIRTIREEIPRLFEHDITYDIYRDDITFLDNITTLPGGMHTVTHGKVRTSLRLPLPFARWPCPPAPPAGLCRRAILEPRAPAPALHDSAHAVDGQPRAPHLACAHPPPLRVRSGTAV